MNRLEMTVRRSPRRRGRKRGSVNRLTTIIIDTIVLLATDPDRLFPSVWVWARVTPKAYLRLMTMTFLDPEIKAWEAELKSKRTRGLELSEEEFGRMYDQELAALAREAKQRADPATTSYQDILDVIDQRSAQRAAEQAEAQRLKRRRK